MGKRYMKTVGLGDWIIIGTTLLMTITTKVILLDQEVMGGNRIIIVRVDHAQTRYKVDQGLVEIFFDFHGHEGKLLVEDGKVRMVPMSMDLCPKQICSKTGWIQSSAEAIVCLPNRILVTIEGASGSLDYVSY